MTSKWQLINLQALNKEWRVNLNPENLCLRCDVNRAPELQNLGPKSTLSTQRRKRELEHA